MPPCELLPAVMERTEQTGLHQEGKGREGGGSPAWQQREPLWMPPCEILPAVLAYKARRWREMERE